MSADLNALYKILQGFEGSKDIDDHRVHAALALPDGKLKEACEEWIFEHLSFSFSERYGHLSGEPYFGPQSSIKLNDGTVIDVPSISSVTQACIAYWYRRGLTTENSVLAARYLGLVWELSNKVSGNKPPIDAALGWIDSIINIAQERYEIFEIDVFHKLGKALSLSISINDPNRLEIVKETIISYERDFGVDAKPGLWGHAFDLLVGNKGARLADTDLKYLINDLEERSTRLAAVDPFGCEAASVRLANYHRSQGDMKGAQQYIARLGDSFREFSRKASPLQASGWLDRMCSIYEGFGMTDEVMVNVRLIRELQQKARSEMVQTTIPFDVLKEDVEKFAVGIVAGGFDDFFEKIVRYFVFSKKKTEETLARLAGLAPLTSLIDIHLTDEDGRRVAKIGSLESDLDGRIVHQISEQINIEAIFLRRSLERGIEKYEITAEMLHVYIMRSPIFTDRQARLLLRGLECFFAGDVASAIHLLIPQIEAAVRHLVDVAGGDILKLRRGNFDYRNLDELLRTSEFEQVFGEDASLYLRVLLTDRRGANLRNLLAHGLAPGAIVWTSLDRVLHVLMLLSYARTQ